MEEEAAVVADTSNEEGRDFDQRNKCVSYIYSFLILRESTHKERKKKKLK